MATKRKDPIGKPSRNVRIAMRSMKTLLHDLEEVARRDRPTVLAGWMITQLTMLEGLDLEVVKSAFVQADLRMRLPG